MFAKRLALAGAMLTLAAPARAWISPEAQLIVDRYVQATGGAAALAADTTLHIKGRVSAMDQKGSFEQWAALPDRIVTRVSLGTVRMRTGFDGTSGWRTDLASKKVTILDGKELEQTRSDAYFATEMWARPGQGGGRVSSYKNGEEFRSIEVTPPVGSPRRLWFSTSNGLLRRMTVRIDQREADSWMSDYRRIGGRLRAMKEEAADSDQAIVWDAHDESPTPDHFTVDSLWVNETIEPSLFASPGSRGQSVAWLKTKGIARIPFRYGTRHVWIKVLVNGFTHADFLLDTGAGMTMIDRSYAEKLGIVPDEAFAVEGMGGADAGSLAKLSSLRIGSAATDGVAMQDLKVGLVDFGEDVEAVMWRHMAGLIGYDVLERFVVEIDYDNQVVTLRDPKTFAYEGGGQPVDMRLAGGIPLVSVELGRGCAGDFLVDVGSSFGLTLHGSLVRSCRLFDNILGHKQVEVNGGGVGASYVSWLSRLDHVRIGPYEWEQPIAGLSLRTSGMVGSKDYGGNIGNVVLERFKVTFDYEHRKLYLEPGRRFAEPERFSRIGAVFVRMSGRVIAANILKGSAAYEAGLEPDDEIMAIDGKPILEFTPELLDRMFVDGDVGATHELSIVHDGEPKKVTVTLKDVL
jgi:hypothetical protein